MLCTKPWVATYVIIFVVIIVCGTLMVLLHYIPNAEMQSVVIHQTDTIIVPLNPSSKWLESVSFQTSDNCLGDLYKIPCDKLQPLRNSSYQSTGGNDNSRDYIYCIDGSSFTWTLTQETLTYDVEIWLFESFSEANTCRNGVSNLDCSKYPMCGVMNNTKRVVTLKPAKIDPQHGHFFFVCTTTIVGQNTFVGTELVIDRYYYNTSVYDEDYKLATISSSRPYVSALKGNFDAAHTVSSSDDCFLFNTTDCDGSKHNGSLVVIPVRSNDVLFWPGLVGAFFLLLLPFLVTAHIGGYFKKLQAERVNLNRAAA